MKFKIPFAFLLFLICSDLAASWREDFPAIQGYPGVDSVLYHEPFVFVTIEADLKTRFATEAALKKLIANKGATGINNLGPISGVIYCNWSSYRIHKSDLNLIRACDTPYELAQLAKNSRLVSTHRITWKDQIPEFDSRFYRNRKNAGGQFERKEVENHIAAHLKNLKTPQPEAAIRIETSLAPIIYPVVDGKILLTPSVSVPWARFEKTLRSRPLTEIQPASESPSPHQ